MWARVVLPILCLLTVLVQPASAGYTPDPHGPQSITVVSDDNYPPYIFRGANGEIQGILVDEWRAWERKTGITVILKAMDWEKAQEAMNRGEADVIDTIFYTEERAKIYDFSKAYARLDVPVFTHVDLGGIVDPPSMRGFTIGVKSGDACIDILKQYGIDTFKEYDSYQDVILAAKRHDIRVFCVDKPPALYYLYKYGIDTEYRSSFVLYTGEFHRAVKKGRTALLRTVEDGFAAISPREHKAIEDKWLGTPLVVREYLQWLIIAGLSIAAVMLALFGFNLILRRQIRTRTAALAESLRNLCKSEDRFRAIFDSVSDCIFIHDTVDGSILEVNDRTCATFGYSRDEFRQLDVGSISSGEAPYTQEEAVRRIQQTVQGQILTFEWHCRKKGGHLFWAGVSTSKATLGGDERVLVTLHDVTERKRAEEALHENQRLLESILNTVPLSIFWQDRNCVFLGCNAAFARSLGKSGPQEIIGKTDFDLPVPYEQSVAHRADDLHVMSTLTPKLHYMEPLTQEDGEHIWLETSKLPLLDDTGQAVGLLGMFENVTDRVNSVDRLKQSEERFSRLFRLSPEAIMLIDATTKKIVDANEAFSSLTGYNLSETLGRDTLELGIYADPANREEFYRLQPRDGHVENMEFEGRRKDGQGFICSLSAQAMEIGSKQYILVMLRNVTELKKMQEMMIQTEKMISIGGIAAGIAHEINNPLGIVLQAAQNLVQRTRPDFKKNMDVAAKLGFDMNLLRAYMRERKLDAFIDDIQSAAVRASAIIRHMLDFSRSSESRRKTCDIPGIIDKAIDLAGSDYDLKKSYDFKRVKITRDYADDLPGINCTETEIEQVLLNILRNAAQALASGDTPPEEPRIGIRVSAVGDNVRIEVSDNGPGMPPEVQRRAFEPFFTTKPQGIGTGLGLSVSYFIVTKGHGGKMSVSSQPGAGTLFTIDLPKNDEQET